MADQNKISREASKAAFEQLLEVQGDVQQQIIQASDNPIARQVAKAQGIEQLREALANPAILPTLQSLAGTTVGFNTDTQYPPDVIRDSVLSALLHGLEIVGNQFNIIAGKMYITLEGYTALLGQVEGLTDFDLTLGNPEDSDVQEEPSNNGKYTVFTVHAKVPARATFCWHGQPRVIENLKGDDLDARIMVSASGKDRLKVVDSLKSKAEKRIRERVWNFIQTAGDSPPPTAESDAGSVTVVEPDTDKAPSEDRSTVESTQSVDEQAEFLNIWRNECKTDNAYHAKLAKSLSEIFSRGLQDSDKAAEELDIFTADLKSDEQVQGQYRLKLQAFARAIVEHWASVHNAGAKS